MPSIDNLINQVDQIEKGEFPNAQEAVKTATEVVQRTWIDYASGVTVTYSKGTFVVRSVTGEYRRSIVEGLKYPALGDKLTGEVSSHAPHAESIEDGIPAFDMKKTHLDGPKAKTAEDGTKYITVPFRHQTPGHTILADAMPQAVYERAKTLAISRRNQLEAGGGKYVWGDRLEESHGGEKEKPHWSTGRYTGMVKMGEPPHTGYLTFRRLSENSLPEAWQHPGVEARPVSEAVKENTEEEVKELIKLGFELDLGGLV